MRKSRLESYESILEALVNGPLTLHSLAVGTNLDHVLLRQRLESLIRNELIQERTIEKTNFYVVTEKGVAVLRALDFQKYLRRLKGAIRAVDEAVEIIPEISQRNGNLEKKSRN